MSQLAIDIIAYISVGVLWIPLALGFIALLIFVVIYDILKSNTQRDYYKSLGDYERKIIDDYRFINPFKK